MLLASLLLAVMPQQAELSKAEQAINNLRQTEAAVASGKISGLDVSDAFFSAMKKLRTVCEAGKAPATAWEAYSQSLVFNSDLPNAEDACTEGLREHLDSLPLLLQLGAVQMAQANELSGRKKKQAAAFAKAASTFTKAVTTHKKSARACIKLGETFVWQGNIEEASDQWREALKRDSAAVDLGVMTQWLGGVASAQIISEQLASKGEDALLLWYLASAEYGAGAEAWNDCRSHFERVIELNPAYDSCYFFLAEGAFAAGQRATAAKQSSAAQKEFRYSAKCWANYLAGNGGNSHLQVAAAAGGDGVVANMKWLGGQAFSAGDGKSAIGLYAWCVKARPQDAEAWNNLAFFYRENGQTEKSLAAYRSALVLQPRDPQVMNDLAVILHYYLRSDDEEAIQLYRDAAEIAQEMLNQTGEAVLSAEEKSRTTVALRDARNNLRKLQAGNRRNG